MTVTSNMTPAWFARDRKMSEGTPDKWKVQSVSGLGDEAYYMWDPRPGSNRNVGLCVPGRGASACRSARWCRRTKMEATKSMLMEIARLALPKLKIERQPRYAQMIAAP